MLELLSKLSDNAEAGFKPKDVKWAIALDSEHGFLEIIELGEVGEKKNRGRTFPRCPDLSQPELVSGSTARSHFLVETAGVVALLGVKEDESKTLEKHRFFVNMLGEAGKDFPELAKIAGILSNPDEMESIKRLMVEKKIKPTDKVTFQLDGRFPLEEDYWHDWWRKFRLNLKENVPKQSVPANLMRCLVTGELSIPALTHSKITGLAGIGGQASGDVLVGFDKEAFCSYGLSQSTNAAVSEQAMNAYCAGLNELIKNHGTNLAGTRVVHWFKHKVEKDEDPLILLLNPPEQQDNIAQSLAVRMLDSIRTGERPDLAENEYYALILSGAGGRVMVRDWIEGPFTELIFNINQWFDDLNIIQRDGNKIARNPKFMAVMGSLVRELKDLPAPLVSKMWRVAVKNELIPYAILPICLSRRKMEILQPDKYPINVAGMALIRAYHLRKYRKESNQIMEEGLQPVVNENFPGPAYHCGRLLAVLAELQRSALGDVGSGVVQRYYAAASTTPALVLGRLTRNSQYHLNKLQPGLAYWYESKIAEIWSRFQDALPATLNLEEQSLFALGYYQQLADMRTKKSKNNQEEENVQ